MLAERSKPGQAVGIGRLAAQRSNWQVLAANVRMRGEHDHRGDDWFRAAHIVFDRHPGEPFRCGSALCARGAALKELESASPAARVKRTPTLSPEVV